MIYLSFSILFSPIGFTLLHQFDDLVIGHAGSL